MKKLYELKKGDKILSNNEILEFDEVRGEKAIFYNEWGIEFEYPDYLYIEEIGELLEFSKIKEDTTPSLF